MHLRWFVCDCLGRQTRDQMQSHWHSADIQMPVGMTVQDPLTGMSQWFVQFRAHPAAATSLCKPVDATLQRFIVTDY